MTSARWSFLAHKTYGKVEVAREIWCLECERLGLLHVWKPGCYSTFYSWAPLCRSYLMVSWPLTDAHAYKGHHGWPVDTLDLSFLKIWTGLVIFGKCWGGRPLLLLVAPSSLPLPVCPSTPFCQPVLLPPSASPHFTGRLLPALVLSTLCGQAIIWRASLK